ncbi:nitroreductase/quinone reductase family protein [Nocardia sp. NPDC050175]|uniref:nitroreductase/quinone reductase family protein n=1 Tax=Nocardia sp. NPDC050175 TaxID=3364317 RepID=UPI0037A0AE87
MDPQRYRRRINRFNRLIVALQKVGIAMGPMYLLTATGRHSGRPRTVPVAVWPIAGERYILQAYRKAAWVANVRAAQSVTLTRGRRSAIVRLIELPVEERRPLLRDHVTNGPPRLARLLVTTGLVDDPSPETIATAAHRIAMFRIADQP